MARPKTCSNCKAKIIRESETQLACPECGSTLWDLPPIELELKALQDKYLLTRDSIDFGNLLISIKKVIRNIILGRLKGSNVLVDDDELDDLINESMEKIINYYCRPHFKITDSFVGYISQVCLFPLYSKKKKQRQQTETSYHAPIESKNPESATLLNFLEEQTYEQDITKNLYDSKLRKELLDIIEDIYFRACDNINVQTGYVLLYLIKEFFNNQKDTYFTEVFSYYGEDKRVYFEKAILLLKNYIIEYEKSGRE